MIKLIATLLLTLSTAVGAQQLQLSPQSKLSFDGTSTLHNFTCTAKKIGGTISVSNQAITAAHIDIEVKQIESGKEDMNKNMYEAFKADVYPLITFDLVSLANDRAKGNLTISGVTKSIDMAVSTIWATDQVEIKGDYSLKMSDFGIKPPTMFLGTIKTGDGITVHFNVLAKVQ